MGKTLIILLVAAAISQNFVLLTSALTGGLSTDQVTILTIMTESYNSSAGQGAESFDSFYAVLQNLTIEYGSYDKNTLSKESTSVLFAEAVGKIRVSMKYLHNSTVYFGGESCVYDETTLEAEESNLDEIISATLSAFELARGGNYPAKKDTIEQYEETTKTRFRTSIERLFSLIRSCADLSRKDIRDLIDETQTLFTESMMSVIQSAFGAIEAYGSVVSGRGRRNQVKAVYEWLDNERNDIMIDVVLAFQRPFALYDALYIDGILNGTNILDELYEIKRAEKEMGWDITTVTKSIEIPVMEKFMSNYDLLQIIRPRCRGLVPLDHVEMSTSALINATNVYLGAVEYSQPDATSKVGFARFFSPEYIRFYIGQWFRAISYVFSDDTSDGCANNLYAIDAIGELQNIGSVSTAEIVFGVARNNETTATDITPTMTVFKETYVGYMQTMNGYLTSMIKLAAELHCEGRNANASELNQFLVYEKAVVRAVLNATLFASYGNLVETITNAGY